MYKLYTALRGTKHPAELLTNTFALYYDPFSFVRDVKFTVAPLKRKRIVNLKINENRCQKKMLAYYARLTEI